MPEALLALSNQPCYLNTVFKTQRDALACSRGDIELAFDATSGVVTNVAFSAALLNYGPEYQNEQGHSAVFTAHLDDVVKKLLPLTSGRRVCEIGCGKGLFLSRLADAGVDVAGFDPAYEGENPRITRAEFDFDAASDFDVFLLRHVLEHIAQPYDFLALLRSRAREDAVVCIEVPDLEWIATQRAWFDIFYEHINYFRPSDFRRLFSAVHTLEHAFGAQYFFVVAPLRALRRVSTPEAFAFPGDFFSARDRLASALPECYAIWGAGAKGAAFSNYLASIGRAPRCAFDINPQKQGCFLPGSGVPILEPDKRRQILPSGSTIVVMNPMYLSEIRAAVGSDYELRTV
jgi:SAM-dependent methyltransferase